MTMHRRYILLLMVLVVVLGGCVTLPTGPSVMVLPAHGKSFEQFQSDDALCRQWARQSIGMSPQEAVNQNAVTGAAVGTAVGAGLGAAIGAASGRAGAGAAIGAASGLAVGASSGASAGQVYGWEAQRRYDISYQQCMYAKGNIIPGNRRIRRTMPPPPPPPPDFEYEQPEAVEPYLAPSQPLPPPPPSDQ
jgi:hypothetical protein